MSCYLGPAARTRNELESVSMRIELKFVGLLSLVACAFLVAASGATVQRRPAGVVACDVRAYVNDPDPKGLNVRSGPGTNYPVIGNLPNQGNDGIEVHINGSSGDWVRIDRAVEQGGDEGRNFFRGEGWVYGPALGVDGVGGFDPPGTPLYQGTTKRANVVARLPVEGGGAKVRGCMRDWTHVEYKGKRGWAAPGTLCYSTLTNCS